MDKKLKISSILLVIVCALMMLLAAIYLVTPRIMPYHEKIIGMTHEQLDVNIANGFLSLLRVIGFLGISWSTGALMLTIGPYRKGHNYSWWVIGAMMVLWLTPLTFYTLHLDMRTPWWLFGLMDITAIAALLVSKKSMRVQ